MTNQPPQRPPPPSCPRCQGLCVWAEVGITGSQGIPHFHLIYARKKPGALFSGEMGADVVAAICLNCGYTAFYVKGLLKLREDFQNHPEWFL